MGHGPGPTLVNYPVGALPPGPGALTFGGPTQVSRTQCPGKDCRLLGEAVGAEVKPMPEATLVHCEDKKEGLCGSARMPPPAGAMHTPRVRLHLSHPRWRTRGHVSAHTMSGPKQNLQRAGSRGEWGVGPGGHAPGSVCTSLLPCLPPTTRLSRSCLSLSLCRSLSNGF